MSDRVHPADERTSQRLRSAESQPASSRGLDGLLRARGPRRAINPRVVQRLQRVAGNRSTGALIRSSAGRAPPRPADGVTLQRDDGGTEVADVSVKAVSLSASKVTLPLATTLTARAAPKNATGVKFSVKKKTVEPSKVTIDASTGAISIAGDQQGGAIEVQAEAADGSAAWTSLQIIEQPNGVASTTASGALDYGGEFVHTFTAPSGQSSGLHGANVNERFASTSAKMPWGGKFKLKANRAGSHGWDLDASGAMTGVDTVDISSSAVKVGPFVKSASNPTPKGTLPQGFTMTQKLFAKSFPGGARGSAPVTTIDHTRTLVTGPRFEVSAGQGTVSEDYTGPAAVTNAKASSSAVMASPPKPATGTWDQRKVTVTADPIPTTASLAFSIVGTSLGCTVDTSGEVSIGSQPGTITVRATASKGNYDEVKITITKYVKPPAEPEAVEEHTGESMSEGSTAEMP